jgi:hypothetical protein
MTPARNAGWGYLTVTCGPGGAEIAYSTVAGGAARVFDSVSVGLAR